MNWRLMRIRFIDWASLPKWSLTECARTIPAAREVGKVAGPGSIVETRRVINRTAH